MVNVPRDWDLVQSNGFQVHIHSPQFGNELVGSGSSNNDFGDLEGNTEGSFLAFTIRWHGGSVGVYNGFRNFDGTVTGNTFDQTHPESQALWHSSVPMS
jgi:hypothetical protein